MINNQITGSQVSPRQSGSAILIAIFVIIIVSLLAASLVSLQRDSAQGASFEVYAARAYLSAYSGSEMVLTDLFPLDSSVTECPATLISPDLPNNPGFHSCSVDVTCTEKVASAGIATRYKLVSTAVCESGEIMTRRQITVEATQL
ncbi:MSHA biogenesis protein MshP [Psychromonas sp. RZ22]|uniref:MSHA biogenesis protein MshP n=1 Tax=Psychromonas algarum TaxID=2555643 RepID=UPI001067EDDD|nr:MSHA biogenesis protein MshP [Psychromonas sp. RZ22]TEW56676.1 MSHA biogenesis protein MshP [Psychromonas sp. RZ22]